MLKLILATAAGMLGAWSLNRHLTRHVPRIFMLHRFSASPHAGRTDADRFVRFLDRLSAECDVVTMRELASRIGEAPPADRPLAAITVDDGYADFHSVALPILATRRLPATVYVTAGFVDGQCWLWWDALRYLVDAHASRLLRVNLPERMFAMNLGDAASRHSAWSAIADHLVTRNSDRNMAILQLEASAGVPLPSALPLEYAPMSWAQLRECEAAGIEIGCHTMTHAYLPTLDREGLRDEIDNAKRLLENHLECPLATFAYPNGMPYDWTPEVERAIRDAGFQAAVLAYPRWFDPADRYRLGRWSVSPGGNQLDHILSGASALKLIARSLI